ncbi:MAG: hypothetical protein OXI96_01100 [Acidimicrobiaceae bacterium]|nr:hypothetical protein [Acidimicrobiaceae bacterium]
MLSAEAARGFPRRACRRDYLDPAHDETGEACAASNACQLTTLLMRWWQSW